MNCKQAQEIILTDYLDGCLGGPLKARLDEHLAGCRACREFVALAQKTLAEPFENLPRERIPESVVQSIKEQVCGREVPQDGWRQKLWEALGDVDWSPRPALAWVSAVVVCFIMVGVGFRVHGLRQAQQEERVLFLAEVAQYSAAKTQDSADYGTSIESYFLNNGGSI